MSLTDDDLRKCRELGKYWNETETIKDKRYFKCNNCDAEFHRPIEQVGIIICPKCLSQNIKKVIEKYGGSK